MDNIRTLIIGFVLAPLLTSLVCSTLVVRFIASLQVKISFKLVRYYNVIFFYICVTRMVFGVRGMLQGINMSVTLVLNNVKLLHRCDGGGSWLLKGCNRSFNRVY